MTPRADINLWVAIPTFIALLVWVTFIVWYSLRARWWKNPFGRNTAFVSVAVILLLLRLVILQFFPTVPTTTVGGFLVYMGIAAAGVHRTYLMEREQRRPHNPKVPRRRWSDNR